MLPKDDEIEKLREEIVWDEDELATLPEQDDEADYADRSYGREF